MFTNGYDKTCTKKNKNKNVLRWRQDKSLTDSNGIWLGQPGKNGKVTYQFIEPVSCHISENSSSFTGASLPKPGYKYSWDN